MIMRNYCVGTCSFPGVLPSKARATWLKEHVQHNILSYICNDLYYCSLQLHDSIGNIARAMEMQQQQLDQLHREIADQQENYFEVLKFLLFSRFFYLQQIS